jgi:biotin carboxyl carrier protein
MKYYVEIGDRTYEVDIGPEGVSVDGQPVDADLQANHGSHVWHLVLDGRSHTLRARRRDGRGDWELEIDGRRHRALALDERSRAIRELAGAATVSHGPIELTAPMPGLVIKVEVSEEERVERGQGLIIIEAMKMENELKATSPGRVVAVRVEPGQAVDKGETLLIIEPVGDGG